MGCFVVNLSIYRSPEQNVSGFNMSPLLRILVKYELPSVRSQLLEVVRDAYPETFEGLLHLSRSRRASLADQLLTRTVLDLFVQQKFRSALPMTYYMGIQRGLDSLTDRHLPQRTTQSRDPRDTSVRDHRSIFGPKKLSPLLCAELSFLRSNWHFEVAGLPEGF